MTKAKAFFKRFAKLLIEKDVFFDASAVTFNLFLFSIPFTLLLASIIGYVLNVDVVMQELSRYARDFFPAWFYEHPGTDVADPEKLFAETLRPLIEQRMVFGIVGFWILVITSLALFTTLKHVIFRVFDYIEKKHMLSDTVYSFFTFGLVGSFFIFFSYLISIISVFFSSDLYIPMVDITIKINNIYDVLMNLLAVVFTLLLFYILFRYLSERMLSRKVAFVGAIIYTTFFEIARLSVGIYLGYAIRTYLTIYQSYTILLILSLWAFYSALIFVIAAIGARAWKEIYEPFAVHETTD